MKDDKNQEISTNRLEAFSDNVFAIAITLLILELKLPEKKIFGDASLRSFLINLWPNYFAYVLSFLIIGIYWANHHYVFRFYKKTDHAFIVLNVLFLMSIAFLPFPTAILGEYIADFAHKETSVTFYTFGLFMPAFFWFMIWLYAKHRQRLIDPRLTKKFVHHITRSYLLSNILYLSSIVVSMFNPTVSIVICVTLALWYLLPPRKPEYENG